MRKKLVDSKIMVKKGTKLIFTEDTVFNSPSAASNMILGRNSNGFTEWINDEGLTFIEVQERVNKN